jgi:hypothetical protein
LRSTKLRQREEKKERGGRGGVGNREGGKRGNKTLGSNGDEI